eukprot:gnl/Hemi2/25269_TR8506_c0_g1_i1.p1 gnl/Hemi2/25269_TR8506_c0_g1~~gnl/Hemi2/25269_TR8506_c0_g1_i1.p1  ORF type:complete len:251 (+),score=86.36 gnl/Hemi2/25269_TR8506_c0_g1_i1:85-837(+)
MIKTPVNQIRLTNVALVRYKKMGIRFEIACYKNKVVSWRNGLEKDIEEVLQTHSVFTNVSKGILAKREDLVRVFETDDQDKICLEILAKGDLQVSERERTLQNDNIFRDVVNIITEKCVDPTTNRPIPPGLLERALKDIHFNAHPSRPAKVQAIEAIRMLQEQRTLPIARAQMRLSLRCAAKESSAVRAKLAGMMTLEDESWNPDWQSICLAEPGQFRAIDELMRQETRGRGVVEVLSLRVAEQGDSMLE